MIAIVVPSGSLIHADTAWCIWQNSIHLFNNGYNNTIINPKCSLVQKGRWVGVKQALELGASHVMFIDSDMTMPPDTVTRLLRSGKDIVGCYYRKRDDSRELVGDIPNTNKFTGLTPAVSLGTGMLLINTEVFRKVPEPWFMVGFENGEWESEDEYFCKAARIQKFHTFCDLDLSKQIGHIGTKVFK